MKKLFFTLCIVAVAAMVGCKSEGTVAPVSSEGYLQLSAEASVEVITRAATEITIPEVSEFSLEIKGENYEKSWEQFSLFESADNPLVAGNYTASVAWGDIAQEGINKPAYAGSVDFEIKAQRVTTASIVAKLSNAQVIVKCTENFLRYFHDESFTLRSAQGNEFKFDSTSEDTVFIAPGAFTINGSALKQTGATITFPEQTKVAEARSLYTYTFDLSTAGEAKVVISLDDTVVEEVVVDTELNPES